MFTCPNDAESLALCLGVALLNGSERPTGIRDHSFFTSFFMWLGEDGTKTDWARVNGDRAGLFGIKVRDYFITGQELFEGRECFFFSVGPLPLGGFLCKTA